MTRLIFVPSHRSPKRERLSKRFGNLASRLPCAELEKCKSRSEENEQCRDRLRDALLPLLRFKLFDMMPGVFCVNFKILVFIVSLTLPQKEKEAKKQAEGELNKVLEVLKNKAKSDAAKKEEKKPASEPQETINRSDDSKSEEHKPHLQEHTGTVSEAAEVEKEPPLPPAVSQLDSGAKKEVQEIQ